MKVVARDRIGGPARFRGGLLGWWVLGLLAAVALGCGRAGGPDRVAVQGKVTVGGQAVPQGSIAFIPTEGNRGPTAGGAIENGQYSIPAQNGPAAGWNRIEITGSQKTGNKVPGPIDSKQLVDEIKSIVPAQYGAKSTLKREIKPGQGALDFDLEAK